MDSIQIRHPGTGRIAKIEMLPMSLWESQESNGKISLRELFNNLNLDIDGIQSNMTVEYLMIVLTGGKMAYTRPDGVKIIPLRCLKD